MYIVVIVVIAILVFVAAMMAVLHNSDDNEMTTLPPAGIELDDESTLPPTGIDTEALVGLSLSDAKRMLSPLQSKFSIQYLPAGSPVTMDWSPDRIRVFYDAAQRVDSIARG